MNAKYLVRLAPAIILAGGLLLGLGVPAAGARTRCRVRIDRAEAKLSNDAYHHGQFSYQVRRDRARLDRIQERCTVLEAKPYPAPHSVPAPY